MISLKQRAIFYSSLSALMEVGIAPIRALETCKSMPRALRECSQRLASYVYHGGTLAEAFHKSGQFSLFECALIYSGERMGNLPSVFKVLRDHFEERVQLRRTMIGGFIRPMLVYHLAGPLLALIQHFAKGVPASTAEWFAIIWTFAPYVIWIVWGLMEPLWNTVLGGTIINFIPFFGTLQFKSELARFLKTYGIALQSGISQSEAISVGGATCMSALYRNAFQKAAQRQYQTSAPISEILAGGLPRVLPYEVMSFISTGEETGTLPDYLAKASRMLTDEIQIAQQRVARAVPVVFYVGLCIYIAYTILTFYAGLLSQYSAI